MKHKNKHFLAFLLILILFSSKLTADHNDTCSKIVFFASKETLRKIILTISQRKKGAYLRFGGKDVYIATTPQNELSPDIKNLQQEMQAAFHISGPTSFRALPYPCKGTHIEDIPLEQIPHRCMQLIQKIKPHWGAQVSHLHDQNALLVLTQNPHDMHYAVRFFKRLKDSPSILFVGNETIPAHIRHLLFGTSCKFVPAPATDAHKELDQIEQACLQAINGNQYTIVVFAAGFAGRILAKRLWHKLNNIFLFDLGPIADMLYNKDGNETFDCDRFTAMLSRNTNILYTAAIINYQADFRRNEYLRCLNILHDYWYDPFIVEACMSGPSFFEQYCNHIFYSRVNNASLRNKGVNEGRSMLQALNHYNFNENDLIIKMTGRYYLKSDSFLRLVEATPDVDGYVTLDPRTFFSFTGCYGLRCKYFREMLNLIDWNRMEREMIDVERIVLDYMRKIEREKGAKILYLDEVDVKSFVAHYWDYDW